MGATTTMAMHQAGSDLANSMIPVVSSFVGSQWKSLDPVYDTGMPNVATEVGSIGSTLTTSPSSDPGHLVSQGLGPRQLSVGLPPHGSNTGAQWSQQPQIQQSPTPPPALQH
ncbi:hypothetical protein V6N13_137814 [Hibiscus sabdariffa]|uniref:Uncharacterized protein n=1 Tax=Hibiscus sabdariffa TaxID=183260 RepID=A0ABR2DL37_9ROSI